MYRGDAHKNIIFSCYFPVSFVAIKDFPPSKGRDAIASETKLALYNHSQFRGANKTQ